MAQKQGGVKASASYGGVMALVEGDHGETDDMVSLRAWIIARAVARERFPQARAAALEEAVVGSKLVAWNVKAECGYSDHEKLMARLQAK